MTCDHLLLLSATEGSQKIRNYSYPNPLGSHIHLGTSHNSHMSAHVKHFYNLNISESADRMICKFMLYGSQLIHGSVLIFFSNRLVEEVGEVHCWCRQFVEDYCLRPQ